MKVAVIPARGGSKRIPRKNIREFCGKPMIAYAIEVANKSKLFDKVIVSTDDLEIAEVAMSYGAEVPFIRSRELANDYAATVPVVADAINKIEEYGNKVSDVCCIYPCTPLLAVNDVLNGLRFLKQSKADYCFPISQHHFQIQRALQLKSDGTVQPLFSTNELLRTQDVHTTYQDAGQFYWGHRDAWLRNPKIHSSGVAIVIPRIRAIDIDTTEDWLYAEFVYLKTTEKEKGFNQC